MRLLRILLLTVTIFLSSWSAMAQDGQVSWTTSVEHIDGDAYRVLFKAKIEKGWHMYDLGPYVDGPNPIIFRFDTSIGLKLDGKLKPITNSIRQYDSMFDMEIGYFENSATFEQKVKLSAPRGTLSANIEWMVCDDVSCMPPIDMDFRIDIVAKGGDAGIAAVVPITAINPPAGENAIDAESGTDAALGDSIALQVDDADDINIKSAEFSNPYKSDSLWSTVLAAMAWALLALLTPCVFPMIPMTVSFFMSSSKSVAHGRFIAIAYGIFIVLLYTLPIAGLILVTRIVGGDAVTADIFNWLSTHWLPNVIFSIVFLVFAASFFGAFEITMPSWLVNKSDKKSDRGGLVGVFFMALTLVLVSFSCTGPLVGNALIESTSGGSFWAPITTMFAFSVVFALPFTFFALFPSMLDKLPKSGGWLNSVKVVLGFVEVALALKFLSIADQTYHWGILDREVYLAVWIAVFSLMGVYLLGKIKFAHDSDVEYIGIGRLSLVILTFSFVVYLIPGMFGAPLKALSGYLPPMHTQDFKLQQGGGALSTQGGTTFELLGDNKAPKYSDFLSLPHGLSGFFDLDEAQAYAKNVGKPLFVDITGHGCVNCREMEAKVWADPEVLDLLRHEYVIVGIYLDDKKIVSQSDWFTTESGKVLKGLGKINSHMVLHKYGVNAQPYYVLQGDQGQMLTQPRGYNLSIPEFVKFLRDGVEAYKMTK